MISWHFVKREVVLNVMTSPTQTLIKSEIASLKVNCYLKSAEIVTILIKKKKAS